jgi:outer membrane protein OmpA-like peptidoglycan-associated protein
MMLLPLLALSTAASAGELMVGIGGGAMVMDPLETLDDTWEIVPRVSYFVNDSIGFEFDPAIMAGRTKIGDHPFTGVVPRINVVGRLWQGGVKVVREDDEGMESVKRVFPPIRPLLVAGLGGFYKNVDDGGEFGDDYPRNDIDFVVSSGPGLLVPFGKEELFHIRTDVRWVLNFGTEDFRTRGDQFVNWEWNAGVGFGFGGVGDEDDDGIVDGDDLCPSKPEDADGFEDDDGCPDLDNDEDGIADTDDECPNPKDPNAVEDMDDWEDDDGCLDADNDGDGILDGPDACPTEAGVASANGCPDEDGDGIVDAKDECVDEAGGAESFGCPDDDGDHVPNYRDLCPTEPAPLDADPLQSDGCPHKAYVTKDAIKILDKVFFDTGRATIKNQSFALLDEIADTLEANANIKKVQIEGHTDNTGDPENNKALSQARAESVMTYLTDKGIAAERLVAVGFGQDKPIATGEEADTTDGRARNRRVEFNITEQETVAKVFTRKKLETEDASVALETLVAKTTLLPAAGTIADDATCDAVLSIDAEGMVTAAAVSGCVALPRSVTRRTFQQWTFEPYMPEDAEAAVPVTVSATMTFAGGEASVTVDESSVTPVTEDE